MTAKNADAPDMNLVVSESLNHVADLLESGKVEWGQGEGADGSARYSLLAAVNEFAAQAEPPAPLLPRWATAILFRRTERVWAVIGHGDVTDYNEEEGRTVKEVVDVLRAAASMDSPLHVCPDCRIEYVCEDAACVGHPARPDDELAREILCRRCWPDRPW